DGVITEFVVPDNTTAWNMAPGPDGNVWFTTDDKYIGKVTPTGAIRLYDVSGLEHFVRTTRDITEGPDGNMWFTGFDGLARITPNGQAPLFPLPGDDSAWKLTTGPDGNLWFTDQGGAIGRMTPQGNVQEFGLPFGHPPDAITAGPDG